MMNSNITTQASITTRLQVWFSSLPLVTKGILTTCVGLLAITLLTGMPDLNTVCLSASSLLRFELWRPITGALFHAGLLHIAFNMMAFVPIGTSLERVFGSVQFLWFIFLLIMLGDAIYVCVSLLGAVVGFPGLLYHCAVGFSGVIFSLIMVDTSLSGATHRSIFGLFVVPANIFPYVLLALWQLLVPGSSLLGHLSGVLVGQLYVMGYLRPFLLSPAVIYKVEHSALLQRVYNIQGFIIHTGGSPNSGSSGEGLLPVSRPAAAGLAALTHHANNNNGATGGGSSNGNGSHSNAGWFRGPWMAFPPNTTPIGTVSGSQGGGGNTQQQQQPYQQQAFWYSMDTTSSGGGGNSNTTTVSAEQQQVKGKVPGGQPPPPDPKRAAAAAAEARMSKSSSTTSAAGGGDNKNSSPPRTRTPSPLPPPQSDAGGNKE